MQSYEIFAIGGVEGKLEIPPIGRVALLVRYPVKSMAREILSETLLTESGIANDRLMRSEVLVHHQECCTCPDVSVVECSSMHLS